MAGEGITLLTQGKASAFLGMNPRTFVSLVKAGYIPVVPYGRSFRYNVEDLIRWANSARPLSDYLGDQTRRSGTRISRSQLVDAELSFAKLLDARVSAKQPSGQRDASRR